MRHRAPSTVGSKQPPRHASALSRAQPTSSLPHSCTLPAHAPTSSHSTPPRMLPCRHAVACLGRYLVVVGGVTHSASGQVAHRQDCALFDTADSCWDVLDSSAFEPAEAASSSSSGGGGSKEPRAAAALPARGECEGPSHSTAGRLSRRSSAPPAPFLGAGSCVFVGSKLLLLKAASGGSSSGSSSNVGQLCELWTADLQLPEAIERQRQAKHNSLVSVVKALALAVEAVATTSVRCDGQ